MKKRHKHITYILLIIFISLYCSFYIKSTSTISNFPLFSPNKEEFKEEIEKIYGDRCKVLLNGDLNSLPQYFDTSQKYGKWALEHEVQRVKYLKQWAYQRGIVFTNINSSVILNKAYNTKKNGVRLLLKEIYKFDYMYKEDKTPIINSFGVGIRHTVDLVKKDDNWVIYTDWYTDCFEDGLKAYTRDIKQIDLSKSEIYDLPNCPRDLNNISAGRYNRISAVEYADKYCGASLEEGSDYKYNKKYKDFNGIGGDCTNYASQVLGDKEAGGLRQDGNWYCTYHRYGGGEGSSAWVNADAFRNYLIYSGKGSLVKKGTFKQLALPTESCPLGIVQKLEFGDLICYAKGHDIDHFAVITGFDSHGYPLINSHTTDRYHVPWDLGWGDKNINFHLVHIR
ncbi:amidase domain-containing protein [Clostridium lundense]|uniref:amidase domain-containing protein n=1 Tax=Clostridium lundense TaxID=319475 RepID=UPI000486F60C|nr:amidase domain-containing protein [Clostridium lundense]